MTQWLLTDYWPMKAPNCPFCYTEPAPIAVTVEGDWHSVTSRRLDSRGHISLCAGLGAIVEPYAIAFTKDHAIAVSELSSVTRGNLLDALDACLESGLFPSNRLTVFEHGGRNPEKASACLEHCHLHIIDGSHDLQAGLVAHYPNAESVMIGEQTSFAADSGYLFTGQYSGNRRVIGTLVRAPSCGSQYFRRLLAMQTGAVSWDWRTWPTPGAAFRLRAEWAASSASLQTQGEVTHAWGNTNAPS